MRKKIRRIVGCQGSIQLLTAVSVLLYRESEQLDANIVYENYLVIYDLYTAEGQDINFALFIETLAKQICIWNQFTYLGPQQVKNLRDTLNKSTPKKIEESIFDLVGTSKADEVYLARNWQLGNQILINLFKGSEKICYGDSIGCYLAPTSIYNRPSDFYSYLRKAKRELRRLISLVIEKANKNFILDEIQFDRAYMLLPEGMGHIPNMMVTVPRKHYLISVIKQSENILNSDLINAIRNKVSLSKTVAILLTSNFSEQNIISLEDELVAYHEFLNSQDDFLPKESVLIIKPHPRDTPSKLTQLASSLKSLFLEIILLNDIDLFFCPFEIIYNTIFSTNPSQENPDQKVHIFAFSSACLSFKLLYDSSIHIGFGSDLVYRYFQSQFAESRIEHEKYLNETMQRISKECSA